MSNVNTQTNDICLFDHAFLQFYNDVKDPSWPAISSYQEFLTLSPSIVDECRNLHGLCSTMTQLSNPPLNFKVCVRDHVVFVPIPKCASTFYISQLLNQGWHAADIRDINLDSVKLIGMIMHPMMRYLKGLTQMMVHSHSDHETPKPNIPIGMHFDVNWTAIEAALQSDYWFRMISNIVVGDTHVCPYDHLLGHVLPITDWIPLDALGSVEAGRYLSTYCANHGIPLQLSEQRLHRSSSLQLSVYEQIKHRFSMDQAQRLRFYKFYGNDLKFYYKTLEKFTSHWQREVSLC